MARILHFSDLHLDSKLAGFGFERTHIRRQEIRGVFEKLIALADAERVDVVLIAGDLFNSKNVSPETIELLMKTIEDSRHLEFFISPGNHDPYHERSIYSFKEWPGNVHIFTSSEIRAVELPELGLRVYGAAFEAEQCMKDLLLDFKGAEDDDYASVLLIHGDLNNGGSVYNPLTKNDIAQSGLDYVALGHIHAFSGIQRAGNTLYAYPGIPEGRGFDECGEKGVIIGDVNKNDVKLEFRPTSTREYHVIETDTEGLTDSSLVQNITAHPAWNHNNIYKIVLKGIKDERITIKNIVSNLENKAFYVKISDERTNTGSLPVLGYAQEILKEVLEEKMAACGDPDECKKQKDALEMALKAVEGRDIPI